MPLDPEILKKIQIHERILEFLPEAAFIRNQLVTKAQAVEENLTEREENLAEKEFNYLVEIEDDLIYALDVYLSAGEELKTLLENDKSR